MTTYIRINLKFLRILIVHFCRLIQFHIQRCFRASLSVQVSNLCQPGNYNRRYFTNKPGHKLYHCMISGSTQYDTILHDTTILHMKKNMRHFVPCARKYSPRQNYHILNYYTQTRFTCHHPLLNTIQKYIPLSQIIFLSVET